jgi:hypothetical protein
MLSNNSFSWNINIAWVVLLKEFFLIISIPHVLLVVLKHSDFVDEFCARFNIQEDTLGS